MISRLFKLFALTILISSLAIGWYWNEYNIFLQTPIEITDDKQSENITITRGMTSKQLANILYYKGMIQHPRYFYFYMRISKQDKHIKAGEYRLTPQMTPVDLLALFISGKVNQYAFTIVEGWTAKDLLQQIKMNSNLVDTLAIDKAIETKSLDVLSIKLAKEFSNNQYQSLEGLLYPDTFHFPKGTTTHQFLKRAYNTMQEILDEEWSKREKKLPIKSPYEALILASIVEKESGKSSERDQIAGVFIRRLKKKMRLQSDPTIIYGMGDKYDGNIRRRDINEKTAYNTYQINGLPPTPIALPGREAINAVLHPDKGKSLYFVADGTGGHVFSNTLKEHNRAVKKYILKK